MLKTSAFELLDAKWGNIIQGVGGGWTAIPNILLSQQSSLGLTSSELNVLINLIRFWWELEQAPFPSPEKIGIEMGINPRSVYRILSSLENKGFIRHVMAEGKSMGYKLDGLIEKLNNVKKARK